MLAAATLAAVCAAMLPATASATINGYGYVEAETLPYGNAPTTANSSAANGWQAGFYTSSQYKGDYVYLPEGASTVSLLKAGTFCGGDRPMVQMWIYRWSGSWSGASTVYAEVYSTAFSWERTAVPMTSPGWYWVWWGFPNDKVTTTCDQNMFLDRIKFNR